MHAQILGNAYDRHDYQGHYQNPISTFVGSQDIYPNNIFKINYTSTILSFKFHIECYKHHNYGHIACDCKYMMESSMKESYTIRYKKV